MIVFRILVSFAVLAAAVLFIVRHALLRQLNSERSRIDQQTIEWSNRYPAAALPAEARSISTNAELSAAEHSELLRLRSELGRLHRELAEATNQPEPLTRAAVLPAARRAGPAQADVTALVQALVAAATNSIAIGSHSFGDDPAPGVVKRLRIEFVLGGQVYTNETTEPGSLAIPAGAEVLRAIYGDFPALDPNSDVVDVTEKISTVMANGGTSVKAANALVGFDPAPMIGKMLRLELRVDGAPLAIEVDEGKTAEIPAGAEVTHAAYGNLRGQKRSSP